MKRLLTVVFLIIYMTTLSADHTVSALGGATFSTIAQLNAHTLIPGDRVLFNRGEVFYGTITVGQSGAISNPIIYGAYGTGTDPIVTGFTTASGFTETFNGSNIWESAALTDGLVLCNIVTINGVNTAMGRTPNSGVYWNVDSYVANTSITSSSLIGAINWSVSGATEVVIRKRNWDWYRNTITAHTGGTVTYTMQQSTGYTPQVNWDFFIQNNIRALDLQNEWYYNPITKKISIYSALEPVNVKVSTKEQLLNCTSRNYITIDGLTFAGGNTAALYSSTSTNLIIQNCTFSQFGYYGTSSSNTDNSSIAGCSFMDGNSSAIFQNTTCDAFDVINNDISGSALLIGMAHLYPYMISTYATNSTIQYNRLTNLGGGGIYPASSSLLVKNNYIDTFFQILNDGGGIYTEGNRTGLIIDGNIILNGIGYYLGTSGTTPMVAGIYLDVLSRGVTISNNTCANSYRGIFVSSGGENTFTKNTCFNTTQAISFKGLTSLNVMTGNYFIAKSSTQLSLYSFSATNNIPTYWAISDSNYFARPTLNDNYIQTGQPDQYTGGLEYKKLSEWQSFSGKDANSYITPMIISTTNDLFFAYNETSGPKLISLPFAGINVKNEPYITSTILNAYKSLVLFKTGENPPLSTSKGAKIGNKVGVNSEGKPFYIQ